MCLSEIPHYPDKSGQAVRNDIMDFMMIRERGGDSPMRIAPSFPTRKKINCHSE
jgi:hypothetical protein